MGGMCPLSEAVHVSACTKYDVPSTLGKTIIDNSLLLLEAANLGEQAPAPYPHTSTGTAVCT